MPLEDKEWDLVRCLVRDLWTSTPDPYAALALYFPNDVPYWEKSLVPATYAETVIRHARAAPLTDPQPLPIRLLDALLRTDQVRVSVQQPQIQSFFDRLGKERAALAGADPFGALILPGSGEVFINRGRGRAMIASLIKPDPQKPEPVVMRVVGEEKTGKSYTYSFILHLSSCLGITPVRVMLSRSSVAEDILRDLSVQVAEPDRQPDTVADPVKRLRHWAQWVVLQAVRRQPPRSWWFVFDQCNELDPSSDAVELIAQLAVAIRELTTAGEHRPRMVLLGYGDRLADLQLPRRQVYVDTVDRVGDTELRDFFDQVFLDKAMQQRPGTPIDQTLITRLVDIAVQQVIEDAALAAADGTPYMKALSLAVEEAVDEFSF